VGLMMLLRVRAGATLLGLALLDGGAVSGARQALVAPGAAPAEFNGDGHETPVRLAMTSVTMTLVARSVPAAHPPLVADPTSPRAM